MVDRFFDAGLEERLEGWIDRGREFVEGVAGARPGGRRPASSSRKPLEAISRRTQGQESWADSNWPDDETFTTNHWQRPDPAPAPISPPSAPNNSARPMPRSYRRRNS
jgi:hypothetical protein